MNQLFSLVGLVTFIAIAWSCSVHPRRFPWRVVLGGLALQFVLAFAVLKTGPGRYLLAKLSDFFVSLLACTKAGSGFVFGDDLISLFAFGALPTIIFFSSLMSILYHLGVMQRLVAGLAWVMRFTLGTSGTETLAAAANVFVGHTEAPLVIRPYLSRMTRSELVAMMTGGFATVTGGLLGVYSEMGIDIGHLLTASIISAPAALLIAKVMVPETEVTSTDAEVVIERTEANVIGAAVAGASEGMKLAINVAAMLIAFLALIAMIDLFLGGLCRAIDWVDPTGEPRLTLGVMLSYVFAPIAYWLGVPAGECLEAGRLIGLKTVANEFIAYADLAGNDQLSDRTKLLLTYALAGFSNLGAVGIMVGGVGTLAPDRRGDLARDGLRAMFGGLLGCLMTGAVVGALV